MGGLGSFLGKAHSLQALPGETSECTDMRLPEHPWYIGRREEFRRGKKRGGGERKKRREMEVREGGKKKDKKTLIKQ